MKITGFESFLANAGLRNYLFIRLRTDTGVTGIGEATLEWQEKTVQTLLHEWVEARVLGKDPFDIEAMIGGMIRDQYQGGATVMTAISGVEIAHVGLDRQGVPPAGLPPARRPLPRSHPHLRQRMVWRRRTPSNLPSEPRAAVDRGYRALKFDPFGTAWKSLDQDEADLAVETVAAVRKTVGPRVGLDDRVPRPARRRHRDRTIRRLEPFDPAWCEEPVAPECLDLLADVKRSSPCPIAAGERLYTLADFYRLTALRAVDVVQMDLAHCGGISAGKKIAAMAQAQDIQVAPHCSIGPVALAACSAF